MKSRFKLTHLAVLSFCFSLLMVSSCSKETSQTGTDAQEQEISTASGESSAEAESTFNEMFDDVIGVNNDVGVAGSGVFYGRPDTLTPVARCFTVTITHPTNNPFPVVVVIDFGNVGCPGPDGHIRRGKIRTEYTNRIIYPGAIATTTFQDYFIDAVRVEGTHKITNISTTSTTRKFKVEVINGKLTKPNGDYIEWNSTNTITQSEGLSTPDNPRDDIFKIEGSASGTVKRGALLARWESNITEPLIKRVTCRWMVKGRIRILRQNLPNPGSSPWAAVLDFGNGDCDNQATITINGVTHQITLP
jgi:hypothetical protein